MPGKNKPKRLDRNRAWRVQRRKRKQNALVGGNSRNRQPRPKHKGVVATVVEKIIKKSAVKEDKKAEDKE